VRRVDLMAIAEPACLKDQRESGNNWYNLPGTCKSQVRERLGHIQEHFCIYCERPLVAEEMHVEHLRSQSAHDGNTLDWGNLSLSCNSLRSCGQHKDRQVLPILPQHFPTDYPYFTRPDGTLVARQAAVHWEELLQVVDLNGELTGDRNLKSQRSGYFDALLEALLLDPPLERQQAQAVCRDYWKQRGLPTTAFSVFEAVYPVQGH